MVFLFLFVTMLEQKNIEILKPMLASVIVQLNKKKYYGFKGHIVINFSGMITDYTFAPANCDERDVAPEITQNIHGLLGADKGYLRPELKKYYDLQSVDLQTPFRKKYG